MGQAIEENVDFHIRHRWPPDVARPAQGKLVLIQPWNTAEFSRVGLNPCKQTGPNLGLYLLCPPGIYRQWVRSGSGHGRAAGRRRPAL